MTRCLKKNYISKVVIKKKTKEENLRNSFLKIMSSKMAEPKSPDCCYIPWFKISPQGKFHRSQIKLAWRSLYVTFSRSKFFKENFTHWWQRQVRGVQCCSILMGLCSKNCSASPHNALNSLTCSIETTFLKTALTIDPAFL